jgi:hypothetical protein
MKIISYKLNSDGTVPDYVKDGGFLPKNVNNTLDMIVIGISKDNADISKAQQEFANESELLIYLNTYLSDYNFIDPITKREENFILLNFVENLFNKIK